MEEFNYNDYFTVEDLAKRGYDLRQEGILDKSHFASLEDAIDDFMNDVFDTIYGLIENYRGSVWAKKFFEDMATTLTNETALEYQYSLKRALIEQAIFTYDNGNPDATFDQNQKPYAPKAVKAMWHNILNMGRS